MKCRKCGNPVFVPGGQGIHRCIGDQWASDEDSRPDPPQPTKEPICDELRSEVKALRERLAKEELKNKMLCDEWADDHTHVQEVAKKCGVPAAEVEGDSYGVPGITDLIDMIAKSKGGGG